MKTYRIYGYIVYLDDNGKVHHAVAGSCDRTFYPYEKSRYGGWDNAVGYYTVNEFRRKVKNHTAIFA